MKLDHQVMFPVPSQATPVPAPPQDWSILNLTCAALGLPVPVSIRNSPELVLLQDSTMPTFYTPLKANNFTGKFIIQ